MPARRRGYALQETYGVEQSLASAVLPVPLRAFFDPGVRDAAVRVYLSDLE